MSASHSHGAGLDQRQFGQTIRELREMRDWTLDEMADRAEVSSAHIGKLERGKASPSLATMDAIASALDLPLHLIIKDAEQQGVTL